MARTLVIKNADFSVNKLDTVTLASDKPCTAIVLNESTAAITSIGGSFTLTATLTPADTTDSVIWSSSDNSIATIAGGVITAVSCGTATITATCGICSATCVVTITHLLNLPVIIDRYYLYNNSGYLNAGSQNVLAVCAETEGDYYAYAYWDTTKEDEYPIPIPPGANKIEIQCQGWRPYGFWMSYTEPFQQYQDIAKAYPKDDGFNYSESATDERTVTIPDRTTGDYEGMNACVFVFRFYSGTPSQQDADAITITFTA